MYVYPYISEINGVKSEAYSRKCHGLLAIAKSKANSGDVSGCTRALGEIREIFDKCRDGVNCGVTMDEVDSTLKEAHRHHLAHMMDEARKIRKSGSRVQAQKIIDRARIYAESNKIEFDESKAQQLLA